MNKIFIDYINEWNQIWGSWNWITITIINVSFEDDISLGGYEFTFILLGLGFYVRIYHTETPLMKKILKRAEETVNKAKGKRK